MRRHVLPVIREEAMTKRLAYLVLVLSSGACSDSTGPETTAIDGTWRFNYTDMTGSFQGTTWICDLDTADFVITQTGSSFYGDQIGSARMTCSAGGRAVVDELVGDETIENGQVLGRDVTFRLGTISGQHSGRISGSSMSGSAQWVMTSGSSSVTLNGRFEAERR
jgi:hypothetical protein